LKNPWLQFKREFESAVSASEDASQAVRTVSIALAWFYNQAYRDDWIVD
jgi:hypothetical protein